MSTIAQKVAAELSAHQPSGWGCLCGGWSATQWHSFVDLAAQFREHAAAHIAEQAEAAVRAHLADQPDPADIAAQALEDAWHDLRVIEATGGHVMDPAAWLCERAARFRSTTPALGDQADTTTNREEPHG